MLFKGIMRVIARVAVSSLTAMALIGSTVGCFSFRPHSAPKTGQIARVTLVGGAPVTIVSGRRAADTLLFRSLSQLQGKVLRLTPDTLTLRVLQSWPFKSVARGELAVIPRSAIKDFAAHKLDEGRTIVALILLTGVVVLIVSVATADW